MAIDSSYIFTNEWCHGDSPTTNAPLPPANNLLSDGRTSIYKGFPQETSQPIDEDGVPPARIDMNGILRQITANLVWYAKGGMFNWVSTYTYSAPAIVRYAVDGNYYKCIASSTVPAGTLPTNQTYWKRILDIDDIGELQDLYLPLTGGTLTGALTGTTGAFTSITCAGSASTSNIGFIGKSSSSGTADKTKSSIRFKNTAGQEVSFNGETGVDLTAGVNYASSSGGAPWSGVTGKPPYIVAQSNGYRKWSDGLIEQWGATGTMTGNNISLAITLPYAYSNTNYRVVASSSHARMDGDWDMGLFGCKPESTTTLRLTSSRVHDATFVTWYTIGY